MKSLAVVLSEHYIVTLECDHEKGLDRAICACAKWEAPWCVSPVDAAKKWATHVQRVYEEKAASVALTYVDVIEREQFSWLIRRYRSNALRDIWCQA